MRPSQVRSHRCTRHTVVTRGRLSRGLARASRIGTVRARGGAQPWSAVGRRRSGADGHAVAALAVVLPSGRSRAVAPVSRWARPALDEEV